MERAGHAWSGARDIGAVERRRIGVGGHDENRRRIARVALADPAADREAIGFGHVQIEQQAIGPMIGQRIEKLPA